MFKNVELIQPQPFYTNAVCNDTIYFTYRKLLTVATKFSLITIKKTAQNNTSNYL